MRNQQQPIIVAAISVAILLAAMLSPLARAARAAGGAGAADDANPYLWLSQIQGQKALAWVAAQNGRSDLALKTAPTYARDRSRILDVLNANTRIPRGALDHGWV